MRGLGAGLIAAAASRGFAAEPTAGEASSLQAKLEDPVSKYPKPPFRASHSRGPDWQVRWIHAPTMARKVIRLQGV
jgi:hypothetical protein